MGDAIVWRRESNREDSGKLSRPRHDATDNRSTTMPSSSADAIGIRMRAGRMAQIKEGPAWLKMLKKRHEELLAQRYDNVHREPRFRTPAARPACCESAIYPTQVSLRH
jgi:hypothetical protein